MILLNFGASRSLEFGVRLTLPHGGGPIAAGAYRYPKGKYTLASSVTTKHILIVFAPLEQAW
jgi:hypothetical protein